MPVLIIGGAEPQEKKPALAPQRKSFGGIGGKYEQGIDEEQKPGAESAAPREAAKLFLKSIEAKDPDMIVEALTTLVHAAGLACNEGEED